VEIVEGDGKVVFPALETLGGGDLELVGPAVLGEGAAERELAALVGAGDEVVDHAGGGVGAVDGGGAVAEDFHLADEGAGEGVDVGGEGGHAVFRHRDGMRGHAAAVDERERAAGAEAAEVDGGDVAAGVLGTDVDLGDAGGLGDAEGFKELAQGGGAAEVEFGGVDDRDGEGGLGVDAAQVAAGDGEGLEADGLIGAAGG
jgi:hypothetical protein